jgi:hypothetical protein
MIDMPDTFQKERERAWAWQQLSSVFDAPDRAFAIHYALQRLNRDGSDPSPPVAAVAVRHIGSGRVHLFSIKREADAAGLDLSAALPADRMNALEYSLLFKLNDFLAAHPGHLFVHWYMRDDRFGFQALEQRFRRAQADLLVHLHGGRSVASAAGFGFGGVAPYPVRIPDATRVDLALVLRQLYGVGPVGLSKLASRNGLSHAELVEGVDEPEMFERGNHARLEWSSSTKARLIAEIAALAANGRLRADGALAARSGRSTHLERDRRPRVFINYRREDTEAAANWLHEILSNVLGEDNVFIDTDDIPAGIDFVEHLRRQIESCDVFLAMIGRRWASLAGESGRLRITDENDFVRREIRAALRRDIPVIPVLVEGTPIPTAQQLPADLLPLRRRQSVELRSREFRADVERLIAKIRAAHRLHQNQAIGGRL